MEMDQAMCTFDIQTFVCPNNNEISYFPHASSCSSFYRCDNGVHEVLDCADGFLWSQELGICNFHHLVDCKQLRYAIL